MVTTPTCKLNGVQYTTAPHDKFQLFNPDPTQIVADPNCPGVYNRAPIANNKITTPINPVAAALFKYYPTTSSAGGAQGVNNLWSIDNGSDHFDSHFGRLDYSLGTKHSLYLTGRQSERDQITNQAFGASNIALGDLLQRINWGGSLGDIVTVSPSTVAEVRLNYSRYVQNAVTHSDGFNFSNLGFPSSLEAASYHTAFPQIIMQDYASLGTTTQTPGPAPFNSYGLYTDVIKIVGKHTVKAGIDVRHFQKGQGTYANGSTSEAGRYTFDNTWVRAVPSVTEGFVQGQDLAALYLGLPSAGTIDQYATAVGNQTYASLFLQDDWRVNSRLTLNLGLRFDKDFSPSEREGQAVNGFDTTDANPISLNALAAYAANPNSSVSVADFKVNGGLTFASPSGKDFSKFTSNMFSPRFGFAYTPRLLGADTVVRGGFGIFVVPIFPFNNSINQEGFSQETVETITNDNYKTPVTSLSNPFPAGLVAPTGSGAGLATFLGNSITYMSPVVRNAYSERYTLDVQRTLPGKLLVEAAYIGNMAKRLPINQYPNFVKRQYESAASNPGLAASVANPFKGLIPNGGSLNGSTVKLAQLMAVYPEFTVDGITVQNVPAGSSSYNSLELHGERRIQNGLTFIANYQFSKLIEALTYLNNSDPKPERRISQYDRPHHLVVGTTYDLPFGKGRPFGASSPRWMQIPLGGWTLNSLYLLQSGSPLSWGNIVPFNIHALNYNPRQATEVTAGTTVPAFDITQFDRVGGDQPTYNLRTMPSQFSNLRTDKLMNWDASVNKNFYFTEKTYFQFKFEAFNVANRPAFSGPNTSPTSSSFGQITGTQNSQRVIQSGAKIVF
jgi:hypothetical protein